MDCFDSLDLCLSCGSHVPDATPYCSTRCRNADLHQSSSTLPSTSSRSACNYNVNAGSSSHASGSHYPHISQRRRPLLELQHEPASSSSYYPEEEHAVQVRKLNSIAEWAQGVYGASVTEDDDCLRMKIRRRGLSTAAQTSAAPTKTSSTPKQSKKSSVSPSRYSPPRFTLTAQNLAPPAMSIAPTIDDSDASSIATPSSSPKNIVRPMKVAGHQQRKSSEVDPWISSPPYEFAYHRTSERGRPLVRV